MFEFIKNKKQSNNNNSQNNKHEVKKNPNQENNSTNLTTSLEKNIAMFKNIFKDDGTIVFKDMQNKYLKQAKCCIFYIDGMVSNEIINENIMRPILASDLSENIDADNLLDELKNKIIISNSIGTETDINTILKSAIYGDTILLLDGFNKVLVINSKGFPTRSISEPDSERIIRGPREGYTESILVNLSLIRRRLINPDFKIKFKDIGVRTNTKTCICYIDGLASEKVIKELERRLDEINMDGILDSGYIQELIKDSPFSPFDTVGATERPDTTVAKLLEGRVALIVDGSPFVLTVPYVLAETFQSNEDYYNNYILASINRFLRAITSIVTSGIPALFLAIVAYHQEMLATPLLLSLVAARADVPIPTGVSLFVMLFIFDLIREATTRMPSNIGQAVSIIGALVLGQAAVEAKLVSSPVLIVTALTGITALMNINVLGASIVFRYFTLLGASLFGIYGFFLCYFIIFLHLMSLRSFGVPYMLGLTKVKDHDGQDGWIRAPWWAMTLRPKIIGAKNPVRMSSKKGKG